MMRRLNLMDGSTDQETHPVVAHRVAIHPREL